MKWTIEKIQSYISTGIEENLHLDYKQLASLKNTEGNKRELAKDVSAFANSDGGTIIYGVVEAGHKPTAIDSESIVIAKEWIENILDSNITPKIDNIEISPIDNPTLNNQLFVISIPKSSRAPHMASDNKYYKRYNFKSQPMEHYEIEDVRNRLSNPNLYFIPFEILNDCASESLQFGGTFNAIIQNNGSGLVEYYTIALKYPDTWQLPLDANGDEDSGAEYVEINGTKFLYKARMKKFFPPNDMPIWRGKQFKLLAFPPRIDIPITNQEPLIVQLSCPDSDDKTLCFFPKLSENKVSWLIKTPPT